MQVQAVQKGIHQDKHGLEVFADPQREQARLLLMGLLPGEGHREENEPDGKSAAAE
jgi:hypothetical protein